MTRPARIRTAIAIATAFLVSLPAGAVGLGPLTLEGRTRTPNKGFYLSLFNPYPEPAEFKLYATGWDDEQPATRVRILRPTERLGGGGQRKLLVVATGLVAGEIYRFRLCAQRVQPEGEGMVNARVCSRLAARRVG